MSHTGDSPQPVDQTSDLCIGEGHGIQQLVIEFCERHLERLMARKGQQTRQKRLFLSAQRFHLVPEK
ncbi:MAG: hypothetical protein V8Q38_04310, partial [Alistipes putredinis]